jgi:Holliday junction resolvase RusA-like endonuclease
MTRAPAVLASSRGNKKSASEERFLRMSAAEFQALPELGKGNGHWKQARGPHRMIPRPLDGEAVKAGALALTNVPPSLNNIFFNLKKGRAKTPAYTAWLTLAHRDLRPQVGWHVPGAINVRLTFRRGETRADLDNLIKPCLDLLVAAGRIADDRNVCAVQAEFSDNLTGVRIEIRAQPPASPQADRAERKE